MLKEGHLTKEQFDALPDSTQRMYREELINELEQKAEAARAASGKKGGGDLNFMLGTPGSGQLAASGYNARERQASPEDAANIEAVRKQIEAMMANDSSG